VGGGDLFARKLPRCLAEDKAQFLSRNGSFSVYVVQGNVCHRIRSPLDPRSRRKGTTLDVRSGKNDTPSRWRRESVLIAVTHQ